MLRITALTLVLATSLLAIVPVRAETVAEPVALDINPVEVRDLLRGVLHASRSQGDLVGAAVVVVHEGRVILQEGFGQARQNPVQPVDAEQTLFRIGSISKVLVAIGVLQLVEAGELDLDEDVNQYLHSIQVPGTHPLPVTLRHLLTHTAGFEDRVLGLFASGPYSLGSLNRQLDQLMPRRIGRPGRDVAYSNFAYALAAQVVADVSGLSWQAYAEQRILMPLGMTQSTIRQPPPHNMVDQMAQGYVRREGRFERWPFEYITLYPAGAVSASASDMGQLMNALLGAWPSTVVTPFVRETLYEIGFRGHESLNGVGHGLYQRSRHGVEAFGHAGSTRAFHSDMLLYPEYGLGLFVAFNADRSDRVRDTIVASFQEALFGVPELEAQALTSGRRDQLMNYSGLYRSLRMPHSGQDRILGLLGTVRVHEAAGGELVLAGVQGPRRFQPAGNDHFQERLGGEKIGFRQSDGDATQLYFSSMPVVTFVSVPEYLDPRWQLLLVGTLVVLLLSAVLLWPWSLLFGRRREPAPGQRSASLTGWLSSCMLLIFVAGATPVLLQGEWLYEGIPTLLQQLFWLPVAAVPLVLAQIWYLGRAWVNGYWWPRRRVHFTLVTLSGVTLLIWLQYWNLMALYF